MKTTGTFGDRPSTMSKNKRQFEKTAPYYEDNALNGTGTFFKLLTNDDQQSREQTRLEAIRGFDPEQKLGDPEYLAKLPQNE